MGQNLWIFPACLFLLLSILPLMNETLFWPIGYYHGCLLGFLLTTPYDLLQEPTSETFLFSLSIHFFCPRGSGIFFLAVVVITTRIILPPQNSFTSSHFYPCNAGISTTVQKWIMGLKEFQSFAEVYTGNQESLGLRLRSVWLLHHNRSPYKFSVCVWEKLLTTSLFQRTLETVCKMIYNTKRVFKHMSEENRSKGLRNNQLDLDFNCLEFRHPFEWAETSRLVGWDKLIDGLKSSFWTTDSSLSSGNHTWDFCWLDGKCFLVSTEVCCWSCPREGFESSENRASESSVFIFLAKTGWQPLPQNIS